MATKSEVERLSVVETKIDTVITDIKDIKASIQTLDKKFAAKWVQTIVAGLVAAILLAFIGVIITFFIPRKLNPTTSETTTTTTPTGSTSTTNTKDGTPSANANANATATPANPTASQSSSSGGLLDQLPLVGNH